MSLGTNKLKIIRGDTKVYNLHFLYANGTDVDITGWKLYFTIKLRVDDTDDQAILKKDITTHIDPTHGKTTIVLSSTETALLRGNYFYDIQMKKVDNTIQTFMLDGLEVVADITRRTS